MPNLYNPVHSVMDTEHGGTSSQHLTLPPVRQARSGVGLLLPATTKATPSLPQSDSNFQLPQMMAERKAELISPSSALLKGFVMVWEKQSQKIRLPLSSESAGEAGGWAFGSCHCARPLHPPTPMNSPHTGWRACGRSSREYRRKHKVPQSTPRCFEIYTDSRDEASQVTGSCETGCSGIFYKVYFTEKAYILDIHEMLDFWEVWTAFWLVHVPVCKKEGPIHLKPKQI